VKAYFQSQCHKIQLGKFSIQDFCFAREVKLGSYSDKGPAPPGALIATKGMLKDPRQEPQYGERVPYVVIAGGPGARLFERCVEPERLLFDEHAELDAEYYISKNLIPPLERIFNLVGANVRAWWDEMPKIQRVRNLGGGGSKGGGNHKTMESYMATSTCVVCRVKLAPVVPIPGQIILPLCAQCAKTPALTLSILRAKLQAAHQKKMDMNRVCRSCADLPIGDEVKCDSRDCPVFYSRIKAGAKVKALSGRLEGVIEAVEKQEEKRFRELEW
jgi:DNA polymerase zeta